MARSRSIGPILPANSTQRPSSSPAAHHSDHPARQLGPSSRSVKRSTNSMSQSPQMITCPVGHTFPRDQLTYRDGLSVCPICDQIEWAPPRAAWSRRLLANPLVLLAAAVVMFLIEAISGVGIGADYQHVHVSGASWLIAGSAVAIVALWLSSLAS